MGQKVNPKGFVFSMGIIYNWSSRWYDDNHYKETLLEDFKIRKTLLEKLRPAEFRKLKLKDQLTA